MKVTRPLSWHQKGFEYERLNTLENEFDILSYEFINQTAIEGLGAQIETKKNLVVMARKVEKLHAKVLNAENRAHAPNPYSGVYIDNYGRPRVQMIVGDDGFSLCE